MKKRWRASAAVCMAAITAAAAALSGCGAQQADGKVRVEIVQYKPEAVKAFEELEERFNATHDDIELVIDSPDRKSVV